MALTDKELLNNDDIIDIKIDGVKKQKFRINGDPKSIIELNLSDMSIASRLEEGLEKLQKEMSEIANASENEDLKGQLAQADEKMREYIDYIFDSPVSEVLGKSGTMYDITNGMFRFEHIIDSLTKLYSDNLNAEFKKVNARIKNHTEKYTSKKPSRSRKS